MDMKELINLKNKRALAVDAMEAARQAKIAAKAGGDQDAIQKAADEFKAKLAVVQGYNDEIADAEAVIAEKGRFSDNDPHFVSLTEKNAKLAEDARTRSALDKVRGDNEYYKAFQKALRTHQTIESARASEDFNPLTKALTITGGETVGEDGGFLVPLDFDQMIITETKDFLDIAGLCNVETVSSNTGWRAVEVAGQRTKLPRVDEMATIGKTNQPKFKKVVFTLGTFGDRLPVSNQLINDVPYLLSYLAAWYGPKLVLTRNDLILSLLQKLPFTALAGADDTAKVKALKKILNVGLNTAHSKAAALLTNQNVYDAMDGWVDGNGRPMLVPDLTHDFDRFKGRPVYHGDNDELGVINGSYDPLYVGNFKRYATLFDRGIMEMASTNVGGEAWATNSTEIRVLCRLDAQEVDNTAVKATGIAQSDAEG